MEKTITNWSKKELQAYLFIYCMNADYDETKNEIEFVKSKIDDETFNRMHTEFEKDNDYISIQKIQSSLDKLGYTHKEIEQLFTEIKDLFLSDNKFDILERNLMMGLKKLLL
ncbi:hypothetical protein C7447_10463 [Tenacibaculum adriaticum]|uniref:Tellurite resistance protein TerB n=1 Tax=Tenacibaculum adriaticum TaxID=413713 RepID=A0A5S5DPS9_9FLAO|nr:hypothetical protein [Tenacibaculum adriaticum]TYP97378.1 hypothetical protein C7447_10463 [Tenacibaculum adriaticum]